MLEQMRAEDDVGLQLRQLLRMILGQGEELRSSVASKAWVSARSIDRGSRDIRAEQLTAPRKARQQVTRAKPHVEHAAALDAHLELGEHLLQMLTAIAHVEAQASEPANEPRIERAITMGLREQQRGCRHDGPLECE